MKRGTKVVSNHGSRSARAHPAKALAVGVITLPGLEDEGNSGGAEGPGGLGVRRLQRKDNGLSMLSDFLVLAFSQEKLPLLTNPGRLASCPRATLRTVSRALPSVRAHSEPV